MAYSEREQFILDYISNNQARLLDEMRLSEGAASVISTMTDIMSGGDNPPGVLGEAYDGSLQSVITNARAEDIFSELNDELVAHGYDSIEPNEQQYLLASHFPDGSIPSDINDFIGMAVSGLDDAFWGVENSYYRWSYGIDGYDDSPRVWTEDEINELIRPIGRLNTNPDSAHQDTDIASEPNAALPNGDPLNEWISVPNSESRYIWLQAEDGTLTQVVDSGSGMVVEAQYSSEGEYQQVQLHNTNNGETRSILESSAAEPQIVADDSIVNTNWDGSWDSFDSADFDSINNTDVAYSEASAAPGWEDFYNDLSARESSNQASILNGSGYAGSIQFGEIALADIGWYQRNSSVDRYVGSEDGFDETQANDWTGEWVGEAAREFRGQYTY